MVNSEEKSRISVRRNLQKAFSSLGIKLFIFIGYTLAVAVGGAVIAQYNDFRAILPTVNAHDQKIVALEETSAENRALLCWIAARWDMPQAIEDICLRPQ